MATLNNNAVASVLNEAIKMSTGAEAIGTLDLQGIVDAGNDATVVGSKEQLYKSLINVLIKNWFTDSSYRTEYSDPFFVESEAYGAIIQNISVEVPEVQASHAWTEYTSGVTTVGEYLVFLPVVHSQYYGRTISWELPISIVGEQEKTAWHSASEMATFVNYILMCVDNALVQHIENMDNANRNNFIAEKIAYATSDDAQGIHVFDFVAEYVKEEGDPTQNLTVEEFKASPKCMLYASKKLRLFSDYFKKPLTLFNTAQRKRFTPNERKVLQVISEFDEAMKTVALSDVYHNELVKLPNFQSVPFWQGAGEGLTFDEVTTIDVETSSDGTKITKSGIVAFLCDKWAILHTIKSRRVASKYFDPEDLTQYYYQFNDMYMNDLTMNAIVFVLNDYVAG